MKAVLKIILVAFALAYPCVVYLGLEHFSPEILVSMLLAAALVRYAIAENRMEMSQFVPFLLVLILAGLVFVTGVDFGIKLYPVGMSLLVAVFFGLSLRHPETVIERLARLGGKTITPRAKNYIWWLTLVWVVILIANALTALYLAKFASSEAWALYCGLISYGIFALVVVVELAYRRYFIAKYGA